MILIWSTVCLQSTSCMCVLSIVHRYDLLNVTTLHWLCVNSQGKGTRESLCQLTHTSEMIWTIIKAITMQSNHNQVTNSNKMSFNRVNGINGNDVEQLILIWSTACLQSAWCLAVLSILQRCDMLNKFPKVYQKNGTCNGYKRVSVRWIDYICYVVSKLPAMSYALIYFNLLYLWWPLLYPALIFNRALHTCSIYTKFGIQQWGQCVSGTDWWWLQSYVTCTDGNTCARGQG